MQNHDGIVVAISPDNRMLHIATSERLRAHFQKSAQTSQRTMVTELPVGTGPEPEPLEFYDSSARPLAADLTYGVETMHLSSTSASGPNAQTLLTRIDAVLAHMQAMLDEHPELGDAGPDTPRITQVPRPEGSLSDVLDQLAALFGIEDPLGKDEGNWWHMMAHAAGTATH